MRLSVLTLGDEQYLRTLHQLLIGQELHHSSSSSSLVFLQVLNRKDLQLSLQLGGSVPEQTKTRF